ncbi:MAG: VWA domain-containing protein, partial [Planctomycetales bacterium]|nr:VWA domain-containing protein [Planctomycetales bacterium]
VLLDISGSMSGEDLANCSIAVLVLVLRVRSEEVAIALFESNTHVMKTFEDPQSLDHVADQVLELQAQGGTCVDAALTWAADQFDSVAAPLSVLFLLSDFCFFERNEELDPHLERLAALKVQLLAASHSYAEKKVIAHFLERMPRGDHVHITDLNTLPELINATLNEFADR